MNTTKIETARRNGIKSPEIVWEVSREVGIPFWVLCAFLEQESGGGANVYGHDVDSYGNPRPFWGHGEVTKANYEAYKKERDLGVTRADRFPNLGRRSQGVGPMQLTFWAFQDEADELGGAWDFRNNVKVGAGILEGYYNSSKATTELGKWQYAALRYNGKQSYVDSITPKLQKWKDLIL